MYTCFSFVLRYIFVLISKLLSKKLSFVTIATAAFYRDLLPIYKCTNRIPKKVDRETDGTGAELIEVSGRTSRTANTVLLAAMDGVNF